MTDIATISTILTSIKTATDIAKTLISIDKTFERAELRLKIAELMESLVQAKEDVIEIKEIIRKKNDEIKELQGLVKIAEEVSDILTRYDKAVIIILKELEKETYVLKKMFVFEHLTIEHLCQKTKLEEEVLKVIIDCLIEEDFLRSEIGEYSNPRLQTTSKARKLLFQRAIKLR